jgi:hypothetical protein
MMTMAKVTQCTVKGSQSLTSTITEKGQHDVIGHWKIITPLRLSISRATMTKVRICSALFFLVIWSLMLCSCGQYELAPDQPQSNHPNKPGSGDVGYY